jgi:putative phosphonate metabolism protein
MSRREVPNLASAPRFAIYFVPGPETALYRFGAAILGHDCYSGESLPHPGELGLSDAEWEDVTREPRTYGFHATLKAPFRLRPEFDQGDLIAEVRTLAAGPRSIPTVEPMVGLIAGFVAVVPRTTSPAVEELAADCVTALDRFRLPMTPQDKSRRLEAGLSAPQIAYLDRFGYPYVLDEFRFHMTLTGRLAPERRGSLHALLESAYARAVGPGAFSIDRIAVLRQDRPAARFRVIDVQNL